MTKGTTCIHSVSIYELSHHPEMVLATFGRSTSPTQLLINALIAQVELFTSEHINFNWHAELVNVNETAHFIAFVPGVGLSKACWYRYGLYGTINVLSGVHELSAEKEADLVILKQLMQECQEVA